MTSYTYLRISLDHTLPRPTKPLLHIGLKYWQRGGDRFAVKPDSRGYSPMEESRASVELLIVWQVFNNQEPTCPQCKPREEKLRDLLEKINYDVMYASAESEDRNQTSALPRYVPQSHPRGENGG